MKRLSLAFVAVLLLAATAHAQKPMLTAAADDHHDTSATAATTSTPEMWLYEQQTHRADNPNPKVLIRERAELRTAQREARIASMNWYGLSNQRPTVSPDVMHGAYSAGWASNTTDPARWSGIAAAAVIAPTWRADIRHY